MGQKVNASAFRRFKNKSWKISSHFVPFNYSLNFNNDFQIIKYLKGFLSFLGIKNNVVTIRRFKDSISVIILFYNNSFYIKQLNKIMYNLLGFKLAYKNFKLFPNINKDHYFRLRKSKGFFTNHLKSFDLYVSHYRNRVKQKSSKLVYKNKFDHLNIKQNNQRKVLLENYKLKKANVLNDFGIKNISKNSSFVYLVNKNYLNLVKFIYSIFIKISIFNINNFILVYKINILDFFCRFYSKYKLFNLFKIKIFVIYLKLLCFYFYRKYILFYYVNNITKILNFFFINKVILFSIKQYYKLKNKKIKLQKMKIKRIFSIDKQGHQLKRYEGISLKRLILFFIYKLSKISNIKVTILNLEKPKNLNRFFNTLKRNVRIRGQLQKILLDFFLILYQSLLIRNPEFFGYYISLLIKKNIKKTGQIFMILKVSLPSFCLLLRCKGVRIQLKGRINGARRSRVWKIQHGQIPLQVISSDVYYSFNKVMTIHGVYGLKIWYHF